MQGSRFMVAGRKSDTTSHFPLARLNANGSLDNGFPRRVQGSSIIFNALLIQPDGKIVAAGDANVGVVGAQPWGYIVRLTAAGELDPTFNVVQAATAPTPSTPVIAALAGVSGGKILVGG